MTVKTFYPRSVSQTANDKQRKFKDLNVIKATGNGYAESNGNIKSKKSSPNRPATVECSDFNCNIPVGATINKITVEYRHTKHGTSNKESCNIPAPTISLLNDGKVLSTKAKTASNDNLSIPFEYSKKGKAPTMVVPTDPLTVTFNGKYNLETVTGGNVVGTTGGGVITNNGIVSSNQSSVTTKKIATTYELLDRNIVNNTKFTVRISYPTNTNTYEGTVRIYWVRIKVEYTESQYALSMSKVESIVDGEKQNGYNHEEYHLKVSINRKTKTKYIPKVTIETPLGFTFKGEDTSKINLGTRNTIKQVNAHVLEYTPALSSSNSVSSASIELIFEVNVSYASGETSAEYTFNAAESLNNASATHTAFITDRPSLPSSDDDSDSTPSANVPVDDIEKIPRIIVAQGEEFYLETQFSEAEIDNAPTDSIRIMAGVYWDVHYLQIKLYDNPEFSISDFTNETPLSSAKFYIEDVPGVTNQLDDEGNLKFSTYSNNVGPKTVQIVSGNVVLRTYEIDVYPNNLTAPYFQLFKLSDEECDRLGDGYSYTVQSYLKKITTEGYVKDWLRNFRIGVFNNAIEENVTVSTYIDDEDIEQELITDTTDYSNLSFNEIFENTEYWGEPLTVLNEFESKTCNFMYDKRYPVYIIITGEFIEGNILENSLEFSEPCIVETSRYNGYEINGIFPEPISNVIIPDDTSLLNLTSFSQTNPFIVYDFPVEEHFGTDDLQAVRGIKVTGNIEQSDELVLYAKLKSPSGNVGQRSIVISDHEVSIDGDTSFTIGGVGDLWGFSMLDLVDLDKWEVEFIAANLSENESNLNFNDVQITFYVENIDIQNVNIKVEGEDISFYNAFITDVDIPPGLETDVAFLNIDGTDRNDAYRQNITEKEIEIEFDIGDSCDITDNTTTLRQLIKLFTNEKDKYNRPIPKRIEFSHYPDVYFEYVMEESPDVDLEINTYHVKLKLLIPSGTSYNLNSTITNTIGYVQGLTSIEPVILLKPLDTTLEVRETVSGQKFNMGYTGDWTNSIIEINCEDRKAYLKNDDDDDFGEDISQYCDLNVDWFRLYGEYAFEGTNCIIKAVKFNERW